ncbi:MAG: hypothetical protein QOG53_2432 [Frankiales bacterium]|jgi:glucose/arabinose dehydrogenase|nr:hypothetical protein [Frankiales bacterium]
MKRRTMKIAVATAASAAAALALTASAGAGPVKVGTARDHSGFTTTKTAIRAAIARNAKPHSLGQANPQAYGRANSTAATPTATVVLGGLDNPRGVIVRPTGSAYVAEAGTGGPTCQGTGEDEGCYGFTGKITKLQHGGAVSTFVGGLISLAGPDGSFAVGVDDVAAANDYNLDFIATSAGPDPISPAADAQLGNLLRAQAHQKPHSIGDVDNVEFTFDPDGQGMDSDPYGVAEGPGAAYQVVADAAGNDILKVQNGKVTVLAIFPNNNFVDADGNQHFNQEVPTRIALGPDGNFYVGMLGSEEQDQGSIWKVTPQGQITEWARGFNAVQGLAFDKKGNLYVGELVSNWGAAFGGGDFTGSLIKVAPNGTRTEILAGQLTAIGGVATAPDDSVYVTTNSLFPDAGELVHITGL